MLTLHFLFVTLSHQQVSWGCTRNWEGTHLGQLTPTEQRDFTYRIMSCSALKAGGKKEEGGTFRVMAFVVPINCMHDSFTVDGWTSTCWREAVNEFLVLVCLHTQLLGSLFNCLYLIPPVFSFTLPILPLPPTIGGVSKWLFGAKLPVGVNPQHVLTFGKCYWYFS